MNCEQVRTLLEGELEFEGADAALQAAYSAHLQSCAECAACAARIPGENEAFANLLNNQNQNEQSQADDEASWQRVKARVAERMAGSRRQPLRPSESFARRAHRTEARMGWSVPMAAAVALLFLAGLILWQMRTTPGSTDARTSHDVANVAPVTPVAPQKTLDHGSEVVAPVKSAPETHATDVRVAETPQPAPQPTQPALNNAAPKQDLTNVARVEKPVEVPHANSATNTTNSKAPATVSMGQLTSRLNQLQRSMADQNILDDVEQLSIALNTFGEPDDRALAEDTVLDLERVLILDHAELADARQELVSLKDSATQFRELQAAVTEAPKAFSSSLKRVIGALDEAAAIGQNLPDAQASGPAGAAWASAELHLRNNEYADAAVGYRAFIEHFPANKHVASARFTLGFLLDSKLGKADEARSIYRDLADGEHSDIRHHAAYHLGASFERINDFPKALAAYKKAHTHVGHDLTEKLAFLEAKVKGVQLANPGWANHVPKGDVLMSPRAPEGHKKPTRTLSK